MKLMGMIVPGCLLAAAGLAVGLMLEYQACRNLDAQNDDLRRQLSKMAALAAENQRLSHALAQAQAAQTSDTPTNLVTNPGLQELAQLRSQLNTLLQQSNDVATLHADTHAVRDALEAARQSQRASRMLHRATRDAASSAPLEILEASYGTDRTNLDVSAELNDRVQGASLKTIAGNQLAGDPDYGHTKDLIVVYRFGGQILTNQFHEGDMVVLPPESP